MSSERLSFTWLLIAGIFITSQATGPVRLIFPKGTKFFVRLNVKENIQSDRITNIFAFAYGFKAQWPLPDEPIVRPVHRRDVVHQLNNTIKSLGLEGDACIKKLQCEARQGIIQNGFFSRVLEILFEERELDCACTDMDACPFSLNHLLNLHWE